MVKKLQMGWMRFFFFLPSFFWIKSIYLCQQSDEKNLPLDRKNKLFWRTCCSYADNHFFLLAGLTELQNIISHSNSVHWLSQPYKTAQAGFILPASWEGADTFLSLPLHQILGLEEIEFWGRKKGERRAYPLRADLVYTTK